MCNGPRLGEASDVYLVYGEWGDGCMGKRKEVSRGKFILSSSHPLYLWNSPCVPGQLRCIGEQSGPSPCPQGAHRS